MTGQGGLGRFGRRMLAAAMGAVLAQGAGPVAASESWDALAEDLFQNRVIHDGAGLIAIEAPVNHPDAGAIPIVIRSTAPETGATRIRSIKLIVDENPAPVVATFTPGEAAVLSRIETTIRVNRFSDVRLVAETEDGTLYGVTRFVKGSGGCSARGVNLPEVAMKTLGELSFDQVAHRAVGETATERQVEVTVQHPNYTGMQQNYVTLYYILAHFMTEMTLRQGDETIVAIETGISVSENPHFRITYASTAPAADLTATVVDSEGLQFQRSWALDLPGS